MDQSRRRFQSHVVSLFGVAGSGRSYKWCRGQHCVYARAVRDMNLPVGVFFTEEVAVKLMVLLSIVKLITVIAVINKYFVQVITIASITASYRHKQATQPVQQQNNQR